MEELEEVTESVTETVTETVTSTLTETTNAIGDALGISLGSISIGNLITTAIILVICLAVVKMLMKLFDKSTERSKLEPSLIKFMRTLLKYLLLFLAILIAAGSLGFDVTSLIALFSVAGLAVSLAVQNSLSNLAGGITILVSKPFKTGDFICGGDISGTVTSIGLVYTEINTIDNKTVFVPNSTLTSEEITNYTHNDKRRIDLEITASYDAPLEDVKAALLAAAAIPGTLSDPAPMSAVTSYEDSAIKYVLRVWVNTADYWPIYFAITENVKHEFDARGIEMTYPHMNVHVDQIGV